MNGKKEGKVFISKRVLEYIRWSSYPTREWQARRKNSGNQQLLFLVPVACTEILEICETSISKTPSPSKRNNAPVFGMNNKTVTGC